MPTPDSSLALLTGPDAGEVLAAAVGTAGGQLRSWRARQVDHRPGSTTVAYTARVAWADREQTEVLAASTGLPTDAGDAAGVLRLTDGDHDVAAWRFPLDPGLPALATATDARAVHGLLADLGLDDDTGPDDVRLVTRAYRPRRRAVLEVRTPRRRLFLKVVRPSAVADLHRRHALLTDAGVLAPRSYGWNDAGLVVLQALPGRGLRGELQTRGPAALGSDHLLRALDALPPSLLDLPARPSWSDAAHRHGHVLGSVLPDEAARATELADAVTTAAAAGDEPLVGVHGDFYEGQLLVRDGRLTGVLDVDTAGPGRRSDDLGCLLAHLEVLGLRDGAERLRAAARVWSGELEATVDPCALRARTAGVLLSLATGPHRVQEPDWERATRARLDLVEHRLAGSRRESTLIAVSG